MENIKKLISFVLKDEFSLSPDEIQRRAEGVAQEQAFENGWDNISVKSTGNFTQENNFKCYPYDVYGNDGGSENTGSSTEEPSNSSDGYGIAAQPLP